MAAGDAGQAPAAAEVQSLVESFCAVTSATPEEAAFFLESHNWALDSAVRSFYDSADEPPPPPSASAARDANDEDDDYVSGGGDEDEDDDYVPGDGGAAAADDDDDAALAAAAAAAAEEEERRRPEKKQKRSHKAVAGGGSGSGRGNVRTLADLGGGRRGAAARSDAESDEDSEDDEWAPPPEYYTGGEKSGMVVRDTSKHNNSPDAIFEQAKRKGAKQGPFEPHQQSSSLRSFTRTGRLLTGETVQSDAPQPPENIVHNIYFWSNGFTVNDGPLRRFDDPANTSFLESIKNSECPKELEPADGRSEVNVNLIRKEGKCPEPVKHASPFGGEGRALGTGSSDNSVPSSDVTAGSTAASITAASPTATLTVDDSLPSTSLQIRFADGTRMIVRFNTHHTIGDVRAFIDTSRPGAARGYTLQVGFPPKPLDDVTKTIEEAGVASSVITQKD